LILHRGAGLLSLHLCLLAYLGSPVIAITHGPELPRLARVEPEPTYPAGNDCLAQKRFSGPTTAQTVLPAVVV
jgi:hypothetical protein